MTTAMTDQTSTLTPRQLLEMAQQAREAFRKGTVRLYANNSAPGQPAKPMRLQGQRWDGSTINKEIKTVAAAKAIASHIIWTIDQGCVDGNRTEVRTSNGRRFSNLVTDVGLKIASEPKPLRLVLNQRAEIVLLAVMCNQDALGLRPAQSATAAEAADDGAEIEDFLDGARPSAPTSAEPELDVDALDSDFSAN